MVSGKPRFRLAKDIKGNKSCICCYVNCKGIKEENTGPFLNCGGDLRISNREGLVT